MIHRPPCAWLLCVLASALILSASPPAGAKPPKARLAVNTRPKPAEAKKSARAQIRLWKASDAVGAMQIRLITAGGGEPFAFPVDSQGLQLTNYLPVPAGAGTIEISSAGRPPIEMLVNLAENSDSTLLVQIRKGVVHTRWIDDTPVAEESGANFNIYNLLGGNGGDMQVVLGDVMNIHLTMPGSGTRLGGLKPAVYPVTVNGTDSEGKTFRWNTETDLKKNHQSTLLIFPDPYGRIRPRLVEDVPNKDSSVKVPADKAQS